MTDRPASEKMRIIHDTKRPMLTDYIDELFDDFIELATVISVTTTRFWAASAISAVPL